MPCNSDYMEPNDLEINLSKVYGLLEEIETGKLPKNYGNGFDDRVYNKSSNEVLNEKVKELCSKLQTFSKNKISKFSLELQIWWRDHQKADRKRIQNSINERKNTLDKEAALSKLTPYERKLLNLE